MNLRILVAAAASLVGAPLAGTTHASIHAQQMTGYTAARADAGAVASSFDKIRMRF